MFSWEAMQGAANAYKALKNKIAELDDKAKDESAKKSYHEKFMKEVNDDLNTPKALAVLNELISDDKLSKNSKQELIADFDEILGLDLLKQEKLDVPKEVQDLVDKREKARELKDFKRADTMRKIIKSKGFVVEDTKDGAVLKKK